MGILWLRKKREYLLTEQPIPTDSFNARTLRNVGNQLLEIANAIRIAFDESVNELCRGGFFFSLLVLNVLRILGRGRVFLDDTGDQIILFFGGMRMIKPILELFNAFAGTMYFTKFPALAAFLMYRLVKIFFAML